MARDITQFNKKVAILRNNFLLNFSASLDELEVLIDNLTPTGPSKENAHSLKILMELLHRLKGSTGTFGLYVLSDLTKNMEGKITLLLAQGESLAQKGIDELRQFWRLLNQEYLEGESRHTTMDFMPHGPQIMVTDSVDSSKTVILVDKDIVLTRLLKIQLSHFGFDLVTLTNPDELGKAIQLHSPAAVVMDVSFSESGDPGVAAIKTLRGNEILTCPLIFISERDDLSARLAAVRIGCDGYLCKPINLTELSGTLSQVTQKNAQEKYKVLVVDDDSEVAQFNAMLLNEVGIEAQIVTSPLETISCLREMCPDLILMDIGMPDCDGFELAAVIRQHSQYTQIPIVFLTASKMEGDWVKAMLAGGDEYLNKDIGHKELAASILARAKRARQLNNMIKKLSASETRFRSVTASASDAIVTSNEQNRVVTWNTGAKKLFGYSESEIQGSKMTALFSDYDCDRSDFELMEMQGIRKEGGQFPVEVSKAQWQADQASFSTIIIRNISRRKEFEKSINHARQLAEKASAAKSDFLAAMSHELRTPMHSILGFGQMLQQNPQESLSDMQDKCVGHILHGGQHLLELIDDVLDLAKIEAGKVDLALGNISVAQLVEECLDLVQPLADKYDVIFSNQDLPDASRIIYADAMRCKQILLNLLSNGAKYNQKGGKVTLGYKVCSSQMLRISVTDTGVGIARKKWPELFQPFSRLGAETSEVDGTGIGLSVSKSLVEMMAGKIGFSSEEGKGSTFWVELPLSKNRAQQAELKQTRSGLALTAENSKFPAVQGTLLYVEDNPTNLRLMEVLVKNIEGLKMIAAKDAESGIEMARHKMPDLILMDINLPGMNGVEALKILQQRPETHQIPVVALSAAASQQDIETGLAAGFSSYLTKPIDVHEVAQTINQLLGAG